MSFRNDGLAVKIIVRPPERSRGTVFAMEIRDATGFYLFLKEFRSREARRFKIIRIYNFSDLDQCAPYTDIV